MKKTTTYIVIILSIFLVCLYTISSTYSIIIEVVEKDGSSEIINNISIKDFLVDENGKYNQLYYDLKKELSVTDEEAIILINSEPLNKTLQTVLKTIVSYKIDNDLDSRLSDQELYDLISKATIEDNNINDDLKSRVINKTSKYKNDISNYIYNIEVSNIGLNK